jgi:hypothetical protein
MRAQSRVIDTTLRRQASTLTVICALLFLATGRQAVASEWKDSLKNALERSYPLTHRAAMSPDRITQQGVVLVIQKQGIAADLSSDVRYSITYVRDGQLGEQGGAASGIFSKTNTRVFKPGDKVYVIGIKIGDDNVMLELMSCDMFDVVKMGSTKQTRYKAALIFKFERQTCTLQRIDMSTRCP